MARKKTINSDSRRQFWTYISHGNIKRVWCTRREYLLLKLSYDDRGLTDEEYKEYRNHAT